jgi:hypothetical protein
LNGSACEQLRAREQLAQRADRVEDADVAGDHLREHRLEDEVVLAIDQRHRHRRALRRVALQRQRRVHAAEAAAQHDHARGFHDFADIAPRTVADATGALAGSGDTSRGVASR